MSSADPLDEEKSNRLRQRLWGAAVFIAILVIFLPFILDGSGSESQYRRVERLREEPPRILDEQGNPEPVATVEPKKAPPPDLSVLDEGNTVTETPLSDEPGESDDSEASNAAPTLTQRPAPTEEVAVKSDVLQAWVIQAGSFQEEANAIAVRDRLRRAGFPSFVTPNDAQTPLYRVRVGPMISKQRAEISRNKVMRLLDREAIVVSYP